MKADLLPRAGAAVKRIAPDFPGRRMPEQMSAKKARGAGAANGRAEARWRGPLTGEAAAIRDGEMMYELLAYTSADRFPRMENTLLGIIESFSRLTDRRALAVEPQRIRIVAVPRAMSAQRALLDAGVVPEQLEELALLNHLHLEDRVERGTLLKSATKSTAFPSQ